MSKIKSKSEGAPYKPSFIEQIQDGVSNFIYYMYSTSGRFAAWSVSGTGLQSKAKVVSNKANKVLGVKWINEIIKNFKERFSG